jgi:hypothetical protein
MTPDAERRLYLYRMVDAFPPDLRPSDLSGYVEACAAELSGYPPVVVDEVARYAVRKCPLLPAPFAVAAHARRVDGAMRDMLPDEWVKG